MDNKKQVLAVASANEVTTDSLAFKEGAPAESVLSYTDDIEKHVLVKLCLAEKPLSANLIRSLIVSELIQGILSSEGKTTGYSHTFYERKELSKIELQRFLVDYKKLTKPSLTNCAQLLRKYNFNVPSYDKIESSLNALFSLGLVAPRPGESKKAGILWYTAPAYLSAWKQKRFQLYEEMEQAYKKQKLIEFYVTHSITEQELFSIQDLLFKSAELSKAETALNASHEQNKTNKKL